MEVELVDGKRGELSFLVDGRVVAKKGLFFKPSVPKVLQAVRAANNANPDDGAANALPRGVDVSRSGIDTRKRLWRPRTDTSAKDPGGSDSNCDLTHGPQRLRRTPHYPRPHRAL